jgi:hypothetical protein
LDPEARFTAPYPAPVSIPVLAMQFRRALFALGLAVLQLPSAALKIGAAPAPVKADVTKLQSKLARVADALDGMLSPEKGSLANSAAAPAMKMFLKELRSTLNETSTMSNTTLAMQKLHAAQAGTGDLTKALTAQQETLMHQGEDQELSLLMGVLMTRRSEPFEQQLSALKDGEFNHLAVSKELLAKHDSSTPLFQQVAAWMDKHGSKAPAAPVSKADRLKKTLAYFQSRVDTLQEAQARMKTAHELSVKKFAELIKKSHSNSSADMLTLYRKKSEREYKKHSVSQQKQLNMMKDVVSALKRGDLHALQKAEDALKASMRAMQSQTGNFLHLLQLGHRLQQRDCPYCAAQCIDKCHTAGNPYTMCLTQCADAGK